MKYLAALLFLPAIALAQAPEGQPQSQQQPQPKALSFEEYKKAMLPALEESLPVMHQTRECVSKAASKEATEQCMITNAEQVVAFQKKLGAPTGETPLDPQKLGRFPQGFEWNEDVNKSMLQKMDQAIQFNTVKQECLQTSATTEEMKACMGSKWPAPSK
jgi:hypothetical protein